MSSSIKNIIKVRLGKRTLFESVFDQIASESSNYTCVKTRNAILKYQDEQTKDNAKEVWRELLIDAVCLLKVNDAREKSSSVCKADDFRSKFESIRNISSFGIEDLEEYFEDFVQFEAVLYNDSYYRDHIHHVLQVWALGISLLFNEDSPVNLEFTEGYVFKRQPFSVKRSGVVKERLLCDRRRIISETELWAMWTIAALCHDLGYPLEKASKINKKVRKIVNHFGCLTFSELNFNFDLLNGFLIEKFLKVISSKTVCPNNGLTWVQSVRPIAIFSKGFGFRTEIQQKYYDKFSKSLEKYKHGMFSGLLLFKKLVYFLETDYTPVASSTIPEDKRQFFIRREILRAICGHTCKEVYHINLNTLSFLLILCDELQEWNRPRFDELLGEPKEKNDVPTCKIEEFKVEKKTTIKVSVDYKMSIGKDEKMANILVYKKFRSFVYLLRSAKDDNKRRDQFEWSIRFQDGQFDFVFGAPECGDTGFKTTFKRLDGGDKEFDVYGSVAGVLG